MVMLKIELSMKKFPMIQEKRALWKIVGQGKSSNNRGLDVTGIAGGF